MTAVPKTPLAAAKLLERYADLDSRCAALEADRIDAIAAANTRAENASAPMLAEIEKIRATIEAWWSTGGHSLAGGKKSMELGGCLIGSRLSRPKLAHGFESDDKATDAVRSTRWAKQTTRVKYSLDRSSTLKLLQLGGKAAADLSSLGFSIEQPENFFVERPA